MGVPHKNPGKVRVLAKQNTAAENTSVTMLSITGLVGPGYDLSLSLILFYSLFF
jgi:hypothetical protein